MFAIVGSTCGFAEKTWKGLRIAGGLVKEQLSRISNFDYNFTKVKQIGFEKTKKKVKICFYHC